MADENRPDLYMQLDQVIREDRGRLLSALVAALGDFELAEDALSDAVESALTHWKRSGVPENPVGWLLKVARRKAIDRIRRVKRFQSKSREIALLAAMDEMEANEPTPAIPDERLRLVFTCCHPALEPKTRVALTLRTLGGLTTGEIARAFLDTETAMGQRLSRARKKISRAGIPYAVPGQELWGERLGSVLAVIYLIFNEGYGASFGDSPVRLGLCGEAVFLIRLLNELKPDEPESEGLLALLLITHARWRARGDGQGSSVALEDQDRNNWDHDAIAQGREILDRAVARASPGPYQIKAAISSLHSNADGVTDWAQIAMLYDRLLEFEPTPIVALNRATARAENGHMDQALSDLEQLAEPLDQYQPFHAAQAEYLARSGQIRGALSAYDRAIELAGNTADKKFLRDRKAHLGH